MKKDQKNAPAAAAAESIEEKIESVQAAEASETSETAVNDIEVDGAAVVDNTQDNPAVNDFEQETAENLASNDFEEEIQENAASNDFEEETAENLEQNDFEEEDESQIGDAIGSEAEAAPKYNFSEEKLEAYLASQKDQDKIIQISRGGNFVSSKDHTVYVPITLFK